MKLTHAGGTVARLNSMTPAALTPHRPSGVTELRLVEVVVNPAGFCWDQLLLWRQEDALHRRYRHQLDWSAPSSEACHPNDVVPIGDGWPSSLWIRGASRAFVDARFMLLHQTLPTMLHWAIEMDMTAALSDERHGHVRSQIPVRLAARPDEVAAAMAFLAGDRATYVSGALLPVDGGTGMGHPRSRTTPDGISSVTTHMGNDVLSAEDGPAAGPRHASTQSNDQAPVAHDGGDESGMDPARPAAQDGSTATLTFGRRLRRARMARQWSQHQLAHRMIDVGAQHRGSARLTSLLIMISKWENGRKAPSQYSRHLLAATLEISVQELGLDVDPDFVF